MKNEIIPLIILVLSSLFMAGCEKLTSQEPSAPLSEARFVKVEQISTEPSSNQLSFNGKVEEKSLTSLSFRVGGLLQILNVNEGDFVRAGQSIATVDKRDYQLQVETRKAQYLQAKGEYERYKTLMTKSKVPPNTFEKIESAYLMAKTGYDNARNQLKDTELISPVSGYVHEKFVENHQAIGPGQPVVSIMDRSTMEVVINVPENQILNLKKQSKNYLSIKKADISNVPVSLSHIGGKAEDDGLYEARYLLSGNKNLNILPGMTATITVELEESPSFIQVPGSAVFTKDNKNYVWVLDPETKQAQQRMVQVTELRSEGKIEITGGLKKGEFIITAGVHSISEGQKLKPIKPISSTNIGGLL